MFVTWLQSVGVEFASLHLNNLMLPPLQLLFKDMNIVSWNTHVRCIIKISAAFHSHMLFAPWFVWPNQVTYEGRTVLHKVAQRKDANEATL